MKKLYQKLILILVSIFFLFPNVAFASEMEKSCQITINLDVPNHFDLPCYAVICNLDTFEMTKINLIKQNDYRGRENVVPGTYTIAQISVVDDVTGQYPFDLPTEPYILEENSTTTFSSRLLNYKEVDRTIKEFLGEPIEEDPIEESIEKPGKVEFPEDEPIIVPPVIEDPIEEPRKFPDFKIVFKLLITIVVVMVSLVLVGMIFSSLYRKKKKKKNKENEDYRYINYRDNYKR